MPRRQRPTVVKAKPVVRTYNVISKTARSLGGALVNVNGDERTVQMNEIEARYWLDQGAIRSQGEPEEEPSDQ